MEVMETTSQHQDSTQKTPHSLIWALPRAVTMCFFAVLFVWIYRAEGGLGTTFSNLFGVHALLMSLFVVVFTQESILTFSAPLFKWAEFAASTKKRFHVCMHLLGIACCIGGLVAIVYYKALSPQPVSFPFCMYI
jgi:hypothetical protein